MISAKELFLIATPGCYGCARKSKEPAHHGLMVNFFSFFNHIKIGMDHLAHTVLTKNSPCDEL